jgi:hypothetical protein
MNRRSVCSWVVLICLAGVCRDALAEPAPDPRFGIWKTLFDGRPNLQDGWFVSRPENERVAWNWKVEDDGSMTNVADPEGRKHSIATKRKFHNFELDLEFKISKGGNSGIYLRGRCEIQIKDSHGRDVQGNEDMGAIYKTTPPLVDASIPAGQWNHIYVRLIGNHITVRLNSELVHDNAVAPPTGQGGKRPGEFDAAHMLELQGDHDQVWFRNVRIRPLFEAPGWEEVFNRKDVSEWFPAHQAGNERSGGEMKWVVQDGILTNTPVSETGEPKFEPIADVLSKKKFENFLLHYEYKSYGNSGLFLRDLWEIQIDSSAGKPQSNGSDGALYAFYPPIVNMSKPAGEWSTVDVKLEGRKITVFHNGVMIHQNRECSGRTFAPNDATNMDRSGHFRMQGDHGPVWFTSLWVMPLP